MPDAAATADSHLLRQPVDKALDLVERVGAHHVDGQVPSAPPPLSRLGILRYCPFRVKTKSASCSNLGHFGRGAPYFPDGPLQTGFGSPREGKMRAPRKARIALSGLPG